jgi:hypothetical protein
MPRGIDTINRMTPARLDFLKSESIAFVARYFGFSRMPEKLLTLQEEQDIHAAGLQVVSVFEGDPTDVDYFQKGAGSVDATTFLRQRRVFGNPLQGEGVYATVDYDAQPEDVPAIVDYFREWRALVNPEGHGTFRLGAYGNGMILQALLDAGVIELTWLSQSKGFLGSKQFLATGRASIVQYLPSELPLNGCDFDYDPNISNGDAGGW